MNVAVKLGIVPERSVTVPPVTTTSSRVNPVTSSLSVMEIVAVSVVRTLAADAPSVASGRTVSLVR